ncbi:hypothetical protein F511_39545 [Dorcoceras hygrometricum]|uniref:Uncharacterized protein n=1 Tax=Dorcoceras hygrometricum TaxID=472368 RepID=A0A2Z7C260_9LAMI|nr:hypothetical protein F511_39545 [Dorcoceras hygrometricum]
MFLYQFDVGGKSDGGIAEKWREPWFVISDCVEPRFRLELMVVAVSCGLSSWLSEAGGDRINMDRKQV